MKLTVDVEIPDDYFHDDVRGKLLVFFDEIPDWKDLDLTAKEEADIFRDVTEYLNKWLLGLAKDWDDQLDEETLADVVNTSGSVFNKKLQALVKAKRAEEERRRVTFEVNKAKAVLQQHGYNVTRKSKR